MSEPLAVDSQLIAPDGTSYRVTRRIAEGGFGVAWEAARQPDGHRVVLKELRVERLEDWKAQELFEREARALEALDHPRIPRYHDFFPAGSGLVLVQDFVVGRSLQSLIDERVLHDSGDIERILRGVLEILSYLHGLHPPLVHRDINPRNVIVDADGAPWLVDFGAIQDRLRHDGQPGSTHVGTLGYMPIEQMMGNARPASDLYALGVTLLVLLTHTPPARLPVDEASQAVDVDEIVVRAPERLRDALRAMVQPLVGTRAQGADEVIAILDERADPPAVPAVQTVALQESSSVKQGAQGRSRPRSWKWLYDTVLALAGLSAAAIYFVFFDSLSETRLVEISPLWVGPIAFGVGGKIAESSPERTRSSLPTALLWAGVATGGLIFFFEGIFPAL